MRKPCLSLAALMLMLSLVSCTRPPAKPVDAPAAPPSTSAVDETGPKAAALFTTADRELHFLIQDAGDAPAFPVEQWLREGDRLVMTADGKPYATWLFDATGVWRLDPKGGGALLRYLPPDLKAGETWRQTSGDAEVWFSLTQDDSQCLVAEGKEADPKSCWTLMVLNRGELTTFRFAPDLGPTVVRAINFTQPSASYTKTVQANQAGRLTAADRKALMDRAPAVSAPRAAVVPATAADFAKAHQSLPGVTTFDLDGDGQAESLRGPLGTWTTATIDILDRNGKLVDSFGPRKGGELRVRLVRFSGSDQPFMLMEQRDGREDFMKMAHFARTDGKLGLSYSYGWDLKATGTASSRVTLGDDGLITVEWDMGDPARHTRVRQYRFDPVQKQARVEAESFRPEGKELVYPTEPLGVLQAAFIARWFGLKEELPRYFAGQAEATAFQARKEISEPNYGPGTVQFAMVTESQPMCGVKFEPAAFKPDGATPYIATWGGYEWLARVWGKVTFAKDPAGRLVIQQLTVEGSCDAGE